MPASDQRIERQFDYLLAPRGIRVLAADGEDASADAGLHSTTTG